MLLTVKGIYLIFMEGLTSEAKPGVYILEAVDVFLMALVFLIFAIAIIKLFVPDAHNIMIVKNLKWLRVRNFTELKMLLWEAVTVTLVVFFLTSYIHDADHVSWKAIILPCAILLLSISYFIMKKTEALHHHEEE